MLGVSTTAHSLSLDCTSKKVLYIAFYNLVKLLHVCLSRRNGLFLKRGESKPVAASSCQLAKMCYLAEGNKEKALQDVVPNNTSDPLHSMF